ncbi:MAG: hypothetical protein HW387_610 [Parachlamydiales bacterium]|nr:hypothetical protein [Parachlamydiales bacterium]
MIRSILTTCFFAIIALVGFLAGTGELQRSKDKPKLSFDPFIKGVSPDTDQVVSEQKPFTIVLYAHNASDWCERALRSVFEQDYERYRIVFVDDGSVDGTLEKAQQFVVQNHQDQRVIAVRNETALGPVGSLYRAAEHCQDMEIIIPLDARNWLAHDGVLSRLNQVFQNPDTWISMAQSIEYPSYGIVNPPAIDRAVIEKRGFRILSQFDCPSFAFYSALFKSIHLPDLLVDGRFSQLQISYAMALLEQAGGRCRSLPEPLTFSNQTLKKRDLHPGANESVVLQSLNPYRPLAQLPSLNHKGKSDVDIVVFSFDRPLQLYGALESIQHYVTGYQFLTVLYRASDDRFNAAYNLVRAAFPKARYVLQSDTPRKDFKPLLLQSVFDSPSEYIVFGVDDMVIKDFVDLSFCRQMLEKTGAYGFYLRFGRHIQQSYMQQKAQSVPPSIPLSNGVFAWDLRKGESDWGFVNSMDMTLYRKADLKKWFTELKYKNPNSLEFNWSQHPPANPIGLYFEHSRMVNLPLNLVHPSDCPHMNFMTAEELLVKFNQGFKMDIDPFYKIENPSPHCDYIPEFIPR